MTADERKPTELLHATDELRQLIIDHPDLPLLIFAGEDASQGDFSYTSCSHVNAYVGEYLDCWQTVNDCLCYTDRDDFEETLSDVLYNQHEEMWGIATNDDWDALLKKELAKYEPFWKPCIILYVNN